MVATPDVNYKVPTDFHFHSPTLWTAAGLGLGFMPQKSHKKIKEIPC